MRKFLDLGSLALSSVGGIQGTEVALKALTEHEIEAVSGADYGEELTPEYSSNSGCSNGGDCGSGSNTGCTNVYRTKCSGSSNDGCNTQNP